MPLEDYAREISIKLIRRRVRNIFTSFKILFDADEAYHKVNNSKLLICKF
jgi:hypothetical protein